ncbi:MAG: NAD(P)-dependent oxidoreductase [Bacteroidales bacterium]|nr:NAD(P)-dependent oxidoreductase [Bacteroidales bacterium]
MKIFIIGGTGLVGSYLLPKLIEQKHEVYALTRSESKIEKVKQIGAFPISGDIVDPDSFNNKLPDNLDFIILLAMPNVIPGKRMTKKRKVVLRSDTNAFFTNSMNLAIKYNVPIILPGGVSFKTENDEIADETWKIRREGITEIGADTDEMVENAIKTGNPKIIQLMYGKIYGNGGVFKFIYDMIDKNKGKIIGKGDNFIPNIHAEDAAEAIIKAIEKQLFGEKFIIADDTPVTQKDFNVYMAQKMNKKLPKHIPAFIIGLVLGKDFMVIVNMNCKVSNLKAKNILGLELKYPSYKQGLDVTLEEMKTQKNNFEQK